MFSLNLLGGVSLAGEAGPLAGPAAQRRRLALLALLATAPEGGIGRDRLNAFLWPDTDPDQARRFLADSLYSLRRALGQQSIHAVGDNLRLDPNVVRCDVIEFRRALARSDWQAAAELYAGPFLDGFFVPGAAEFEQWTDTVREQLARQRADALERLAAGCGDRGDHVQAARWWRQLQVADPLNSRVALQLMAALHAAGDPGAALRHAQIHEALLRDELGVAPGEAITALVARIRSAPTATPQTQWTGPGPAAAPRHTEPSPTAEPASPQAPGAPAREMSPAPPVILAHEHTAAAAPVRTGRPHVRTTLYLVLAVTLAGAAAASVWLGTRASRQRIFVAAFENRTGDVALDPLGSMAADWIARGLMGAAALEVMAPTWSIYVLDGTAAQSDRTVDGRRTTLVAGSYYLDNGRLRLEARIVDHARGSMLHALEPVVVPVDSSTLGVDLLRQRIAAALAARFGALRELREITMRTQPPTYAAYLDYVRGVQSFSHFRLEQAARHFESASAADSSFHLAALYSILVAYNTGNRMRGDSIVRTLTQRRDRMVPLDRGLLEAFEADMAGDPQALVRALRSVVSMAPGSQFAVGFAAAAVAANRPREALHALQQLDPQVGLLRDNPRYWEWLTASRHLLGQHRQELQESRRARAQHPVLGAALLQELRALAALGEVAEMELLLDHVVTLPADQSLTAGDIFRSTAAELHAHGRPIEAARALERALAWYLAQPRETWPRHRGALARTLFDAGRLDEARALYEELAAEQPANVGHAAHLALLAARRGDGAEARSLAAALPAAPDPRTRSLTTLWHARIAAQLGDTERALDLLRSAFAEGAAHGLWLHVDGHLAPLRRQPAFRRMLEPGG